MGFVFKSAIGLGVVYFAMFGQALRVAEIAPAADLCASAAVAGVHGEAGTRATLAVVGCSLAVKAEAEKLTAPRIVAAKPAPAPVAARPAAGTLTEADLRDPWFGPAHLSRKASWRG